MDGSGVRRRLNIAQFDGWDELATFQGCFDGRLEGQFDMGQMY